MNFFDYVLKKKLIVYIFTILLIAGGVVAFNDLGRLEDPEFTIKEAKVMTTYPGASPQEVEQEVTDRIEVAIQELSQLKRIKSSTSQEGLSIITPEIKDRFDKSSLPQVWDELRRKVGDVQNKLPPGAGVSVVNDDFGDVYGLFYAVTGADYSYRELEKVVDALKRELLLVPGVAKIELWGVQPQTVYLEVSRTKLTQLGIKFSDIVNTISQHNIVKPAGNVSVGSEYITIRTSGEFNAVEDIANLLIRGLENNRLIYIKDVAEVKRGYEDPPKQIMRFNGEKSIAMAISAVPGTNIVEVAKDVQNRIQELKALAPLGIQIEAIYNQGAEVDASISGFMVSLVQAIVIVIVVLLFFMGLRSGIIIGLSLLLSILGTFIFMQAQGIFLERISLGALIIALGMLVDNAIVVTDGILVRFQKGENKEEAAKKVVAQTMWPLLGATLVGILAFAAISMSQDSTGEYTRSLFQVMLISLLLSWVVAVFITPLLCISYLKVKQETDDQYQGFIFRMYRGFLARCIQVRWLTVLVMAGLLGTAIYAFKYVDRSFFPDSTMKMFLIDYWRVQGSDIKNTSADMQKIEKYVNTLDGVTAIASFVGAGAPRFTLMYTPEDPNPSYGQLMVNVTEQRLIGEVFIPKIRKYLEDNFPQAEPNVKKFRMGTSQGFLIQGRFSGKDPRVLRQLAEKAEGIMREDGRIMNIRNNWRQQVKLIRPIYSESQGRRVGVSRADVSNSLAYNYVGITGGVYREEDKLLPIVLRAPYADRNDVADVNNIQVWSPIANGTIPIRQVVSGFETSSENQMLKRRNRLLTITFEADPLVGNSSEALSRIKDKIEAIPLPPGYIFEWGGEYEDSLDAQAGIYKNLPIVFLGMVLLVIILFNALRQPLIIWLCVPMAIIGVTAGLLLTGQSFGFMALLGFLSLSGMLIKNAVVLIDQIDLEICEEKQPFLAILDSSVGRVRPVSLAAFTTILGMIPLLFDVFFVSMAVTIMFGLFFATFLTLLFVPVLYAIFFRIPFEKKYVKPGAKESES